MKLVLISDTHGQHADLELPQGDVLLHAGDLSRTGKPGQLQDFFFWLRSQPHPHKIIIAGNHDFMAERDPQAFRDLIPEGVHYLENSGVEIEGVRFWGSPITPSFMDWAFNQDRGEEIAATWAQIPENTDVLLIHGPPYGILDQTYRMESVGCQDLLFRIREVDPRLVVFGHIHEAAGRVRRDGRLYVNASQVDLKYRLVHPPVLLDWPLAEAEDLDD